MKRSEMIDEIVCCLLAYSANYPHYPLSNLKLAAEEILKIQEEKGMLPPDTKKGFWVQVNYGTPDANYQERKPMNEWEPEND